MSVEDRESELLSPATRLKSGWPSRTPNSTYLVLRQATATGVTLIEKPFLVFVETQMVVCANLVSHPVCKLKLKFYMQFL